MSPVNLRFLGSGDAFGSGGRLQTCFYVESASARFLIDCGASSLIAMKRFGVDPAQLDYVLLTHFHADHFGGVAFMAVEERIFRRRSKPLVIAGPRGVELRVREAMETAFPGSTRASGGVPLEFVELSDENQTRIGPLCVVSFPVIHSAGTEPHALRIECAGKVIAYSGDTEWTDALIPAAEGADLFICEAYFFEKKVPKHLEYKTLVAHRHELSCRRLILTHMNDDLLNRLPEVDEECAEDGKKVVL